MRVRVRCDFIIVHRYSNDKQDNNDVNVKSYVRTLPYHRVYILGE